ncbi:hypothetical protein BC6307_23050 [Sutcliffiella cohnii]|uniref:Uncharacterized protein n=1 Tax=Sutcliffiella cohnii TaxID=33932 RepID=A0A223KWV6_9BACI|nr:hypothetical protein BC6307_23050 [Sutcliffiella cohnii]
MRGYMRTGAAELTKRFEAYRAPTANTEVKLFGADGSWGLSPCESRTSPGRRKNGFVLIGADRFFVCSVWERPKVEK